MSYSDTLEGVQRHGQQHGRGCPAPACIASRLTLIKRLHDHVADAIVLRREAQ